MALEDVVFYLLLLLLDLLVGAGTKLLVKTTLDYKIVLLFPYCVMCLQNIKQNKFGQRTTHRVPPRSSYS